MRKLLIAVILCGLCNAQEIRRPTTDSDGGANLSLGCLGSNEASSSMSLAYDAAGLSTSSTSDTSGTPTTKLYRTRIFSAWQTTGNAYSALNLNINSSSPGWQAIGLGQGQACIAYSINLGASWTSVRCDTGTGWSQQTDVISLSAAQDLSRLRVGVCTQGNKGNAFISPGEDELSVFDIWTSGTVSGSIPAGSGSSSGIAHRNPIQPN